MSNIAPTTPAPFSGKFLKSASYQWLTTHSWDVWATLTTKEYTTAAAAQDDLKHLWNLLDRQAYGNASKKGKRINRACLIDLGANNTNVHYHIVALTPANTKWTTDEFCQSLKDTWQKLHRAGDHNQVEPIDSASGCVRYICGKFQTNLDQLDLDCSHF
jgi:hypothetical protein